MGKKGFFRKSQIRLVTLFFISLPLIFFFNNCKTTDVDLNDASANTFNGMTEESGESKGSGEGGSQVGENSETENNGHGYSGKLSFISYDLTPPAVNGVTEFLPDNKLVISEQTNDVFYSSPSKEIPPALVEPGSVRELGSFNPYYLSYNEMFYFQEGFSLYQGVKINGNTQNYRTPVLSYCHADPEEAVAAGISGVDMMVAQYLIPNQTTWKLFSAPMVTHLLIGSLQDSKKFEYETSFKSEVKRYLLGYSVSAQNEVVNVFYHFQRAGNVGWNLSGTLVYKGNTINLTCDLMGALKTIVSKPEGGLEVY